ncbi:pirin family protein [Pendulispora rubella]|uniref:Pirin family protein n=1 Tax=Pendulispora rubella TaxID=2741070 RepID=A0ABZ2LAB5_9BACT
MARPILAVRPLGFPWETPDPFLFCVHHRDAYPAGNEHMGPAASLAGRNLGQDFELKDGWRMYHGDTVPGFPQHPHRGFETVTIARQGYIDHSDSLGAAARFGPGDVQWLTAGEGVVHSEMFPLIHRDAPNTVELFQIWLNLPGEDKLAPPHFSMLWNSDVPRAPFVDGAGRTTEVTMVAGTLDGKRPPSPPSRSWASRPDTDVAIWCIRMEPRATWTLPRAAHPAAVRQLYFFEGDTFRVADDVVDRHAAIRLDAGADVSLAAGEMPCEMLLLQGRPIAEPVVQYGPFVMNTRAEIERAIQDYQRTQFGGWPWPKNDPVHARDAGRFARHVDGRIDKPTR